MKQLVSDMQELQKVLNDKNNIKRLLKYYQNKFYIIVLLKQYERLLVNIKSIEALLDINSVEDAYTIFRKYIETYAILVSVYENVSIVDKYLMHDSLVGLKACGLKKEEIKKFCLNKPDGFLEYGYLEGIVNTNEDDFKYTMKTVCKAAKLNEFYQWYKQCNNFVHNNLSSVNIDQLEGQKKLIEKCKKSFECLKVRLYKIIN